MIPRSVKRLALFPVLALCLFSCNDLYNASGGGDDTPRAITYDANGSVSGTVPVDPNSYKPGAVAPSINGPVFRSGIQYGNTEVAY